MPLKASQLTIGDTYSERVCDELTRTQIVQYAGASGDFHPLHTDEVYAREAKGLKSVFAPGMLTMGLTGKMLTNWLGDARLRRFGVRFVDQVWPGDALDAKATITAIRQEGRAHLIDLVISTVDQNGKEVMTGHATAEVDP